MTFQNRIFHIMADNSHDRIEYTKYTILCIDQMVL